MGKKPATRLIHNHSGGRLTPTVNPPLERGSTFLMEGADALYNKKPSYGRMGLAQHRELADALCDLEGGIAAQLTPNGLSACGLAMGAMVTAGDHVLVSDSAYGPTRRFAEKRLKKMGVEATFFAPGIGSGIADIIRDNTALIFLESPGSLTFEISDTPAIVSVAKAKGIKTALDNTWGAGVFHRPLELGVDISVQALTKYPVGHADALGGAVISADKAVAASVKACAEDWGLALSPDDAYLALRGLRTLHTRLKAHEASALEIAHWLSSHPDVTRVIHPALASHPDHNLWARDFTGSCGLFGATLTATTDEELDVFLDALCLFGLGYSWGGYESLLIPCDDQLRRSEPNWTDDKSGPLLRLHAGLEDTADLIDDLSAAFEALRTHRQS